MALKGEVNSIGDKEKRKTSVLWSSLAHPKAEEVENRTVSLSLDKRELAAGVCLPALSRFGCVRCRGRERSAHWTNYLSHTYSAACSAASCCAADVIEGDVGSHLNLGPTCHQYLAGL